MVPLCSCSDEANDQVKKEEADEKSRESSEFKKLFFGPPKTSLAMAIRKYSKGIDRAELASGTKGLLIAGKRAVDSDDYYSAEEILSEALRRDPDNGEAYFLRGRARSNAIVSDDKLAREDLEKAIQLGASSFSAYKYLARIYSDEKQYDKALGALGEMIRLEPKSKESYRERAAVYIALGQNDKALEDYTHALKMDPTNSDIFYKRGQLFELLKRYDEAMSDYKSVIANENKPTKIPLKGLAYRRIANLLSRQGKYQQAVDILGKAIELDSSDDEPLRLRGDQFMKMGKVDRAIEDYTKAVELAPETSRNYHARSIAYEKSGQKQLAERDRAQSSRLQEKPAEATLYELK